MNGMMYIRPNRPGFRPNRPNFNPNRPGYNNNFFFPFLLGATTATILSPYYYRYPPYYPYPYWY